MTRAQLDALLWKGINLPAGGQFIIPIDKIYEVYVHTAAADPIFVNGGEFVSFLDVLNTWFPLSSGSVFAFAAGDTVQGAYSTAPQGWLFSSGDVITCASAFSVRWRDVTEQQLGS